MIAAAESSDLDIKRLAHPFLPLSINGKEKKNLKCHFRFNRKGGVLCVYSPKKKAIAKEKEDHFGPAKQDCVWTDKKISRDSDYPKNPSAFMILSKYGRRKVSEI